MSHTFERGTDEADIQIAAPAVGLYSLDASDEAELAGRVRDRYLTEALELLALEPNNPHRDEILRYQAARREALQFEARRPTGTIKLLPMAGNFSARAGRRMILGEVLPTGLFLGHMRPNTRGLIYMESVKADGFGNIYADAGLVVFPFTLKQSKNMIEVVRKPDGSYSFSLALVDANLLKMFLPIFVDQSPHSVEKQAELDKNKPGLLKLYFAENTKEKRISRPAVRVMDIPPGCYGFVRDELMHVIWKESYYGTLPVDVVDDSGHDVAAGEFVYSHYQEGRTCVIRSSDGVLKKDDLRHDL